MFALLLALPALSLVSATPIVSPAPSVLVSSTPVIPPIPATPQTILILSSALPGFGDLGVFNPASASSQLARIPLVKTAVIGSATSQIASEVAAITAAVTPTTTCCGLASNSPAVKLVIVTSSSVISSAGILAANPKATVNPKGASLPLVLARFLAARSNPDDLLPIEQVRFAGPGPSQFHATSSMTPPSPTPTRRTQERPRRLARGNPKTGVASLTEVFGSSSAPEIKLVSLSVNPKGASSLVGSTTTKVFVSTSSVAVKIASLSVNPKFGPSTVSTYVPNVTNPPTVHPGYPHSTTTTTSSILPSSTA